MPRTRDLRGLHNRIEEVQFTRDIVNWLVATIIGGVVERLGIAGITGPHWSAYVHTVPARKRVRLILKLGRSYRSLAWFTVLRDRSVVLGIGMQYTTLVRTARRRGTDAALPAKLSAGLGERSAPEGHHLTFHTSGVINETGGPRTYRASLSSASPHQLCSIDFAHPALFRTTEPRPLDVILPYVPLEHTAVRGRLTVVPDAAAVFFDDTPVQTAIVFSVQDGRRVALPLQFSLLNRNVPWPAETNVISVSQDPAVHGFAV